MLEAAPPGAGFFEEMCQRLGLDPADLPEPPRDRRGRLIVGVSDQTATKLREFHYLVDTVASYTANINRGRLRRGRAALEPFVAVDLSAGSGAYQYKGRPHIGSPLLLLEVLLRRGLRSTVLLVDEDTDVVSTLRANLSRMKPGHPDVTIRCGDMTIAEDWLRARVRPWLPGLLVIDVNDVFTSPAVRAIAALEGLDHIDVALHVPGVAQKWPRTRSTPVAPDAVQGWFGKAFWQLAPLRGNYQWFWMYGTNNPGMRELVQRGLVSHNGPIGQHRMDMVKLSRRQRWQRNQLPLSLDPPGGDP